MGHVRNYSIGDVIARQKRMAGANVLHPIGWDALGMPAENAAIKHGTHPRDLDPRQRRPHADPAQEDGHQLRLEPRGQHLPSRVLQVEPVDLPAMLERGLAFRKESWVNWCPQCQTVLANEQVVGGGCWRCETPVTQKKMEQWFLKITAYADELLTGHAALQKWPDHVLQMQKNWIGRSTGAHVHFGLDGGPETDRGLHDPDRHDLRRDLPRRLRRASRRAPTLSPARGRRTSAPGSPGPSSRCASAGTSARPRRTASIPARRPSTPSPASSSPSGSPTMS